VLFRSVRQTVAARARCPARCREKVVEKEFLPEDRQIGGLEHLEIDLGADLLRPKTWTASDSEPAQRGPAQSGDDAVVQPNNFSRGLSPCNDAGRAQCPGWVRALIILTQQGIAWFRCDSRSPPKPAKLVNRTRRNRLPEPWAD